MATTFLEPQQIDEKYHFLLRRLHSLSGIVPLGVFLLEHMLTNSRAFHWFGWFQSGPGKFNEAVQFLHGLPYLPFLEFFGIFLPLAFHAIYGIKIALGGQSNARSYPYMANWRYTLQRVAGYVTFVFVVVHLLKFRFAHWIGWGPEFIGSADPFEITRRGMTAWNPGGDFIVPPWFTFALYGIGLTAACFHFANGIWTFCITWGITIGKKGQRNMGVVATAVGVVLLVWGGVALYAFATAGPREGPMRDGVLAGQAAPLAAVAMEDGAAP